jgi:mono/diheme cytochrome c family protein
MPVPRAARPVLALIAVGTAAFGLAACQTTKGDSADLEAGKTLFTGQCGYCHVLADAGSKGGQLDNPATDGPNLDDAFRGARWSGWKDSQFEGVVMRWIKTAQPPMPRDIVTGKDAENIAAYVASVAGKDMEPSGVRPAENFDFEPRYPSPDGEPRGGGEGGGTEGGSEGAPVEGGGPNEGGGPSDRPGVGPGEDTTTEGE